MKIHWSLSWLNASIKRNVRKEHGTLFVGYCVIIVTMVTYIIVIVTFWERKWNVRVIER